MLSLNARNAEQVDDIGRLPLFERPTIWDDVNAIAHLDSLCFYAGAGVSIDRTGLSWHALIKYLLRDAPPARDHIESIVDVLGVLQGGSIAEQRHMGPEPWHEHVAQSLRKELHEVRGKLAGGASPALAQLYLALTQQSNKPARFSILTTNYDVHIEQDIADALGLERLPERRNPVVHLHGRIGMDDGFSQLVISEQNYRDRNGWISRTVKRHFSSRNVLIMGSSLDDPTLVNALINTKAIAAKNGLRRWAIIARRDIDAEADEADGWPRSRALIRASMDRMDHLGVCGIYVDYYSQIGQLLLEIIEALGIAAPQTYADSEQRYGRRLADWWSAWHYSDEQHMYARDRGDWTVLQVEHSKRMQDIHRRVCRELDILAASKPVLDVWIRWAPAHDSRMLKLWTSSDNYFPVPQENRSIPIEARGAEPAVLAFTAGRVVYPRDQAPLGREANTEGEWIAMPIRARSKTNLAVGSLVIRCSEGVAGETALNYEFRRRHAFLLTEINDELAEMLSV